MLTTQRRAIDTLMQELHVSPTHAFATIQISDSVSNALVTAQDHPAFFVPENGQWLMIHVDQVDPAYLAARIEMDKQCARPDIAHWAFITSFIEAARRDQIGVLMMWWGQTLEPWVAGLNET